MNEYPRGDYCPVRDNCSNFDMQCWYCVVPDGGAVPTQYAPIDRRVLHPATVEYRQRQRTERKMAKQTDAAKRGKRNKRNGYRSEKDGERELARYGFKRVPLSGALDGHPGDLRRDVPDGRSIRMIENKRRVNALGYVEAWLAQEGADAVRLDPGGRRDPLIILPLDRFVLLLAEAGYGMDERDPATLSNLLRDAADELERR